MSMPPLLHLVDQDAYMRHFECVYCKGSITTFDGIQVRFQKRDFYHCCFESNRRTGKKEYFSPKRAERIDWIKAALQDPTADLRVGWDNSRKRYDSDRRVCTVSGNYVVVISLLPSGLVGRFITAYVADSGRTMQQIKKSPKWGKFRT